MTVVKLSFVQDTLPDEHNQIQLLVFSSESLNQDSEHVFIDGPCDAVILVQNLMEIGSLYLNQLARFDDYDRRGDRFLIDEGVLAETVPLLQEVQRYLGSPVFLITSYFLGEKDL